MSAGICPHCKGPIDAVTYSHGQGHGVYCGSCNLLWRLDDAPQRPLELEEPEAGRMTIIEIRVLKAELARKIEAGRQQHHHPRAS